MKRLLIVALGAYLVSTPVFAKDTAAPGKSMNATGTVSAISPNTLTVKVKRGQWAFAVNTGTHVTVAGATKKTASAKENKEALEITRYVKVGDVVTVTYHNIGSDRHAAGVRVRDSLPGTK